MALFFAVVVLFDAQGVRRASGQQAQILNSRDCIQDRTLVDYAVRDPHLVPTINHLTPNDHWLDAGAGLALPMRELARSRRSIPARLFGKRPPLMTALALKKPDCKELNRDLNRFPEFRYDSSESGCIIPLSVSLNV